MEVLQCLYSTLKPAFGPNGLDVMIFDDGCAISTNYGLQLSKPYLALHPAGSVITRALNQYLSQTGDGSKRLIMMILFILKRVKQANVNCSAMSHCFKQLVNLFTTQLIPALRLKRVSSHSQWSKDLKDIIFSALTNCISPHFSTVYVHQITELVTQYLLYQENDFEAMKKVLKFISERFDSLVLLMEGVCSQMKLVPGVYVGKEVFGHSWLEVGNSSQKAVLLRCGLNPAIIECSSSLTVSSADAACQLVPHWVMTVRKYMECLARNEIKLILMKGALPKGLLTVLDEFGICAITMIPDDTIKTIEVIGNGVFRSICDVKEILSLTESNILHLAISCENQCMNVMFTGVQMLRPFTVVLEAPSCGIGKQLKIAFKNSMLVLLQLLKENSEVVEFVYGGGAWEIWLIQIIEEYFLSSNLAKSSQERQALKSIQDGLYSILTVLVSNATVDNKSKQQKQLIQLHQEVFIKKSLDFATIDSTTGNIRVISDCDVIEPLSSIELFMKTVLLTVSNVLNIDEPILCKSTIH